MTIAVNLPEAQAARLRDEADRLGVPLVQLATAAVVDFVERAPDDFERAAEYVLRKNEELYRRLA